MISIEKGLMYLTNDGVRATEKSKSEDLLSVSEFPVKIKSYFLVLTWSLIELHLASLGNFVTEVEKFNFFDKASQIPI